VLTVLKPRPVVPGLESTFVTLEGTLDDAPSVSPKVECQCIVVFDVRDFKPAQQFFDGTYRSRVWRDPDAFVVIHIHLAAPPCNEVDKPGQRVQVQCA
jgi:hypothetical protein